MEKDDTVKNLGALYIHVSHLIDNAIKKEVRRKGMAPKVGAMLYVIYRLNSPSPLELAHVLNRKPQTITAIIHRMEQDGLVIKDINISKKNTYKIQLTEKGFSECQKMMNIDVLTNSIDSLSDEKREHLQDCLEEILVKLKRMGIS